MKTNQEIQKLKDKTFILNLNVPKNEVEKEYQHTLKEIQSGFETKGFRKGKAPLNVVKQQISPEKMLQEVISHLISHLYEQKVKEYELKPIIQPQIKIKNPPLTFDKEWQIELTACELPETSFDLSKVSNEIKKINATPIKKEAEPKHDNLDQILEVVIKNSQLELPAILIDSDIENHSSSLIDQTKQAGITITQYLKTKNLTLDQYKENLKDQIIKEWTINLAVEKIAKSEKMEVSQKEIESLLSKNPQLASNINLVYFLLTQQKVFEYLQNLK
ncbi:MAG: trigger factor [Candidatus Shapirobacteria bacterium]|nr:trigger factor [Candidatus Shapirobacteria bacterium]